MVRARPHACALPLSIVIETMRPLRTSPLAGMPSFVRGVSVIRGSATPVIDLGVLLGMTDGETSRDSGRFVTLRVGVRQVALAVEGVLGVRELGDTTVRRLPPLLRETGNDTIHEIASLDQELLILLREAWVLPTQIWSAIDVQGAPG